MTDNGADVPIHQSREAPGRGDSVVKDSRPLKTPLEDAISYKEHNYALKVSARNAEGNISPYQPRPPSQPRLPKPSKSGSMEETVRGRRLRNSQESLSDPTETGSSTDSLKEDQAVPAPGGLVLCRAATISNEDQDPSVRVLSAFMTGSQIFRDRGGSLSEHERRPHSQQSGPTDPPMRSTKVRLSPVQPTGPLPALEKRFASATRRAANRIDRDCLDYAIRAREKEKFHRNLSDSRLLENMGSDSASVSSMRSTYSVLSPIRPQDVRNRYSRHSRPCSYCTWSHPQAYLQIRWPLEAGVSQHTKRSLCKYTYHVGGNIK